MVGVGKAFGDSHQPVTVAAHLPAQPVFGLDRGGHRPGLAADLPGPRRATVLIHRQLLIPSPGR
jgi:hypothetical protein